jgi:broad specificity phosphatase PhoE
VLHTRSIPAPAARPVPMPSPGITRRRRPRRPFLAPLWLISAAAAAVVGVAFLVLHMANTTVVVLVQERASGDALSAESEQRAQRLAAMFGSAGQGQIGRLDALYVSDVRDARESAAPLAELLGRQPVAVPRGDAEATASRVMGEHSGDTVLVVGTGDMVPDLVRQLSGIEVPPAQDDVGYVVSIPSIGRANVLRFRY